ncbi:hypothetical protein [Maribellus sp. CM-23]|nr:hypothetical protein [Maribellus sp. CM-23]
MAQQDSCGALIGPFFVVFIQQTLTLFEIHDNNNNNNLQVTVIPI